MDRPPPAVFSQVPATSSTESSQRPRLWGVAPAKPSGQGGCVPGRDNQSHLLTSQIGHRAGDRASLPGGCQAQPVTCTGARSRAAEHGKQGHTEMPRRRGARCLGLGLALPPHPQTFLRRECGTLVAGVWPVGRPRRAGGLGGQQGGLLALGVFVKGKSFQLPGHGESVPVNALSLHLESRQRPKPLLCSHVGIKSVR